MSDTLEGIEKDPRVESLYEASQKSPGLCDVRHDSKVKRFYIGPGPGPSTIRLNIEIDDAENSYKQMMAATGCVYVLKNFGLQKYHHPDGSVDARGFVELQPFDPHRAFIECEDVKPAELHQDPQPLTPACGGYHDPRSVWGAQFDDGGDVSLAEGIQD
jgi:hypothetical protein